MKNKIKNLLFDSKKGKVKLNEKASIFFFCLALATFFWFLSSLSKSYTTDLSIPLKYVSYNKEFIITEAPPENIIVTVFGSGFDLLGEQVSLNRNVIKIDLSKAIPLGKNRYGIATQKLTNDILSSLDKDLKFERITTDSIIFFTDKRVSKRLRVVPKMNLTYESSYNLNGEVSIEPSIITVSGPKSEIDTLNFLTTELISEDDLEDSLVITQNLKELKLYKNLTFDPEEIKITIPVEKFTEKIFELEIEVNSKKTDIITFPNKVKVVFLVPLNTYELLQSSDLKAEVNFNSKTANLRKLPIELKGIPSFAKLLRIEPKKVEFIIKQ